MHVDNNEMVPVIFMIKSLKCIPWQTNSPFFLLMDHYSPLVAKTIFIYLLFFHSLYCNYRLLLPKILSWDKLCLFNYGDDYYIVAIIIFSLLSYYVHCPAPWIHHYWPISRFHFNGSSNRHREMCLSAFSSWPMSASGLSLHTLKISQLTTNKSNEAAGLITTVESRNAAVKNWNLKYIPPLELKQQTCVVTYKN